MTCLLLSFIGRNLAGNAVGFASGLIGAVYGPLGMEDSYNHRAGHELDGKLDGVALRVPTPNVSLVDLKFTTKKKMTVEEIHKQIDKAAAGPLKGVLEVIDEPLVSSDLNHNPASSAFDKSGTKVMDGGKFGRIMTWYDNEWGFSNRMSDTAVALGKLV